MKELLPHSSRMSQVIKEPEVGGGLPGSPNLGLSPAVAAGGAFGWHGTHWDLRGKDTVSYSHFPGLHISSTRILQATEFSMRPSVSTWMLSLPRRVRLMYPVFYFFPVNDCLFLNLSALGTLRRTWD